MELIVAIAAIYLGGPLALILIAWGGYKVARNKTPGEYGWAGLVLILGVILLIFAVGMFVSLSNTNLGL